MIWRTCIKQNGDSTNENRMMWRAQSREPYPMTYTYCLGCHDQNHVHFGVCESGFTTFTGSLSFGGWRCYISSGSQTRKFFYWIAKLDELPSLMGLIMVKPSFFGKTIHSQGLNILLQHFLSCIAFAWGGVNEGKRAWWPQTSPSTAHVVFFGCHCHHHHHLPIFSHHLAVSKEACFASTNKHHSWTKTAGASTHRPPSATARNDISIFGVCILQFLSKGWLLHYPVAGDFPHLLNYTNNPSHPNHWDISSFPAIFLCLQNFPDFFQWPAQHEGTTWWAATGAKRRAMRRSSLARSRRWRWIPKAGIGAVVMFIL